MLTINRQVKHIAVIIAPLIMGVILYALLRTERPMFLWWMEPATVPVKRFGFVDWLPDYLWCFSYLAVLSWIWQGWKKIPSSWLYISWMAIMLT